MIRRVLAVALAALLASPAWSNPGILGTAASSRNTSVRGAALQSGSTLFAGDTIEVGSEGAAYLALSNGARLQLFAGSEIRLDASEARVAADVLGGRMAFRADASFEARLADASIRAAGNAPATAHVFKIDANRAAIYAESGEVLVTAATSGKSVTLREGESVEVTLAAAPAPQWGNPAGAGTLTGRQVAILGLVVGGIVTAIAIILNRGETNLTDREKRNEVSPFRFP